MLWETHYSMSIQFLKDIFKLINWVNQSKILRSKFEQLFRKQMWTDILGNCSTIWSWLDFLKERQMIYRTRQLLIGWIINRIKWERFKFSKFTNQVRSLYIVDMKLMWMKDIDEKYCFTDSFFLRVKNFIIKNKYCLVMTNWIVSTKLS